MTTDTVKEDERVRYINQKSSEFLADWLTKLEAKTLSEDDFLSSLYAAMVAAYLYEYLPEVMVVDAKAGCQRLLDLLGEEDINIP